MDSGTSKHTETTSFTSVLKSVWKQVSRCVSVVNGLVSPSRKEVVLAPNFEAWLLEQKSQRQQLERQLKELGYSEERIRRNIKDRELRSHVELAKQLYNQSKSQGQHDDDCTSVDEIVTSLKKREIDYNHIAKAKGVRASWFLQVFCNTPYAKRLIEYGCEIWFVRDVCVTEILRREGIKGGALVDHLDKCPGLGGGHTSSLMTGVPTVFLSYTGKYTLSHFIKLVSQLKGGEYLWVDAFCVDQFDWTGSVHSGRTDAFASRLNKLKDHSNNINKFVLLLDRWNDVNSTLRQVWVLWEMYGASEGERPLEVLLSTEETNKYLDYLKESQDDLKIIGELLSSIDMGRDVSQNRQSYQKILGFMDEENIHNTSCKVGAQMRSWLVKTGLAELDRMKMNKEQRNYRFMNNLVRLLLRLGELSRAEPLCQEALEQQRFGLKGLCLDTRCAMDNMVELRLKQGKFSEAEKLVNQREWLPGDPHAHTDPHQVQLGLTESQKIVYSDGRTYRAHKGNIVFRECMRPFFHLLKHFKKILNNVNYRHLIVTKVNGVMANTPFRFFENEQSNQELGSEERANHIEKHLRGSQRKMHASSIYFPQGTPQSNNVESDFFFPDGLDLFSHPDKVQESFIFALLWKGIELANRVDRSKQGPKKKRGRPKGNGDATNRPRRRKSNKNCPQQLNQVQSQHLAIVPTAQQEQFLSPPVAVVAPFHVNYSASSPHGTCPILPRIPDRQQSNPSPLSGADDSHQSLDVDALMEGYMDGSK